MAEGRVYGRNPVLELLRAHGRRADEIAVLAGARGPLAEVVALARRAGVQISYRTREQPTAVAGSDQHQGVGARGALVEIEVPFGCIPEDVVDVAVGAAIEDVLLAFCRHGGRIAVRKRRLGARGPLVEINIVVRGVPEDGIDMAVGAAIEDVLRAFCRHDGRIASGEGGVWAGSPVI